MQVYYVRVEGVDAALACFVVSSGAAWRVVGDGWEAVVRLARDKLGDRLAELLARYPQAMEYVTVTVLFEAPKFVVDQLVRHRHASWMVSSSRHGTVVTRQPDFLDAEELDKLADLVDQTIGIRVAKCLARGLRPEICSRLVPPLLDTRLVLLKTNLRELAHMYCYRRHRGGQRETVKLLEMIRERLPHTLQEAIQHYCREWGYTDD